MKVELTADMKVVKKAVLMVERRVELTADMKVVKRVVERVV